MCSSNELYVQVRDALRAEVGGASYYNNNKNSRTIKYAYSRYSSRKNVSVSDVINALAKHNLLCDNIKVVNKLGDTLVTVHK